MALCGSEADGIGLVSARAACKPLATVIPIKIRALRRIITTFIDVPSTAQRVK